MKIMDQEQIPHVQGVKMETVQAATNDFIRRVYGWMGVGLVVTAIVAFIVGNTPALVDLVAGNTIVFFVLVIIELAAVVAISRAVKRLSSGQAGALFLVYAALNGLTISVIFLVFTLASIGSVFIVTAAMFAAISLYGYFTKRDLTTVGHLAFMGLIGIIIASLVNLFIVNDVFTLVISYISVLVFTGLTAYDNQKLKIMSQSLQIGSESEKRASVIGALTLYLDFINLFLDLLNILGGRRR